MITAQRLQSLALAKNYQWTLGLDGIGFLAESCTPPRYQAENIDVMLRGVYAKKSGIAKPQPFDVTFLENGTVVSLLHGWMMETYDPSTGCGSEEGKQITLTVGGCGAIYASYTIFDARCESVTPEQLVSESGNLWKISANISYSRFEMS